jgi:hypothetical protein
MMKRTDGSILLRMAVALPGLDETYVYIVCLSKM